MMSLMGTATHVDAPVRVRPPASERDERTPVDLPPLPELNERDREGVCPECGHEAFDEESNLTKWLRRTSERLTRRKPKPARCQHFTFDEDWQDMREFCQCRNPFHGS